MDTTRKTNPPAIVTYQGREYYRTGKIGTNRETGNPSAEYADREDRRVWLDRVTGIVAPD